MLAILTHIGLSGDPGFSEIVARYGYIGIFIWFITFDQLTPLPEEISLLLLGYLGAHHVLNPFIAAVVAFAGFLSVDTLYFQLVRTGSRLVKKKAGKTGSTFLAAYRGKLKENMPKTLLVLCFIPRMRMWGPILSGSMKLPFKKFMLFDSLGIGLFTVLYISLGFFFYRGLAALVKKMELFQHAIFLSFIFVMAVVVIVLVSRRKKKLDQPESGENQ